MRSKPLTSAQIRAARALIRWSAEDLARETTLSVATIRRAELTEDETSMTAANDLAARRALERMDGLFPRQRHVPVGVAIEECECLDDNGNGGVKLRACSVQQVPLLSRLRM